MEASISKKSGLNLNVGGTVITKIKHVNLKRLLHIFVVLCDDIFYVNGSEIQNINSTKSIQVKKSDMGTRQTLLSQA